MATNVEQAYYGWPHEESSDRDESQEVSAAQMLDHGSISFGRFAFESLSWERRSVFTHNTPQEELEKFTGMVAKKKAYFEDYYKRIRALKAIQDIQQTELTLDYGGDGSISSQAGEEDEIAAPHGSFEDGASNLIDACSKEAPLEMTSEKDLNCNAIQVGYLVVEPTSSMLDSSREGLEEAESEKKASHVLQVLNLDTELTVHESLIEKNEDVEKHDPSGLHDKGCSSKYEMSESKIELEQNSTDVQIQNLDRESVLHESSVRMKETEQHKYKRMSGEYDNVEKIVKPEIALAGPVLYPTKSKVRNLGLKRDNNTESGKFKPTAKQYEEDQLSVSKVKGPAASVRNDMKLELKTQSGIKSSQGPKYPYQKTIIKAKACVGSSKAAPDRVLRNYKATKVTSPKPLTEVRSNVEKRATNLAGIRDSAPILRTKTPNRLESSRCQTKDVISVQVTSKKVITYDEKSRGLENKRVPEEVRKIALPLDSRCTNLKGRGASIPTTRSLNLPAATRCNPNPRGGCRSSNGIRNDKLEEVKVEAKPSEVKVVSTKVGAPSRTPNHKAEFKKAEQLSHNGRKPGIGWSSANEKKPRQEMPRWR